MALAVTYSLGTGHNRTHVKTNFDDVVAWANSTVPVTDANLASPNNAAYKELLSGGSFLLTDAAAGTYPLLTLFGGGVDPSPTALAGASGGLVDAGSFHYFDDADYTVASKTTKLRVRGQVSTNGTVPAITFTFGLYPVTFSGAADVLTATLGTVVAGSTAAVASPAANLTTGAASSDATIPSDGLYCLGCVTSGTLTNNAACLLSAQLSTRSV